MKKIALCCAGIVVLFSVSIIMAACQPPQQSPAANVLAGSSLDNRIAALETKIKDMESNMDKLKGMIQAQPIRPDNMNMNEPDPNKVIQLKTEAAPVKGPETAPVSIVVFECLQCPACARVSTLLNEVQAANPDKVKLVFMDAPLISKAGDGYPFHPYAMILHEAAAEAQAQGKFWEMYDFIFGQRNTFLPPGRPTGEDDYQAKLDQIKAKLVEFGGTIGMDTKALDDSLTDHRHQKFIMDRRDYFSSLNLHGTPSIFINGKFTRLTRADNMKDFFQQKIDAAATEAQGEKKP